jgi:hypothetical protein
MKYATLLSRMIGCLLCCCGLLLSPVVLAQKTDTPAPTDSAASAGKDKKESEKTIDEVVKSCVRFDGLFPIFQDSVSGKLYLKVSESQLGREFIHFYYTENGASDAGWVRGSYGRSRIFKLAKHFNTLDLRWENTDYYYDPAKALSRSAHANITAPVVSTEKIVAMNAEKNEYLIEADRLFLTETFVQVKRMPSPESTEKNPFKLGELSKEKTRCLAVRNYPQNSDVIVEYVFENKYPTNSGAATMTDARYVSVTMQHSLIALPENDYEPRYDDPRVGYFMTKVNDQLALSPTPYRDMIHRWHLKKKNPGAAISEPVEPITFWMENTTPEELRPLIRQGVEAWNIAFEQAGFKNAVVVREQPQDADWDAGDLRYHVLRWTSAPLIGAAWGPSYVNPRTGQILGADIMLDYIFVRGNRVREELYESAANLPLDAYMFPEKEAYAYEMNDYRCEAAAYSQDDLLFGQYAGKVLGASDAQLKRMLEERIISLVMHEVGHTLGLNHNFKSSQLWDETDIHNADLTRKQGLTGSVMDYAPVNLSADPTKQGEFHNTVPGPYDLWAIEFGYAPSLSDKAAEKARVEKLLSRSTEPQLVFGNDADDMRSPGAGIDPTIMIRDMSSDAIGYAEMTIDLSRRTLSELEGKLARPGSSYQEMRDGYNLIMSQYLLNTTVISRYVGGVKIDRAMIGQPGATQPLTPVSYEEQKRAMMALRNHAFSPGAFQAPETVYNRLQIQRRGFDIRRIGNEDPKIHDQMATLQKQVLAHLLHPVVLKRMTDAQLYGNRYSVAEMMNDLTDAVFADDLRTAVSTPRQNLQLTYVDGLISALGSEKYDPVARSAALYQLTTVRKLMKSNKTSDASTLAHRQHVMFKIHKAMDAAK